VDQLMDAPPEPVDPATPIESAAARMFHLDQPAVIVATAGDPVAGIVPPSRLGRVLLTEHEEDIARSPDVGDERIAAVKRAIDGYNQQRNDWIERIDETLGEQLAEVGVMLAADARLNTETPGSAIDRLSIMALRIYHMWVQLDRVDVSNDHRRKVQERLELCYQQHQDLSTSLTELIDDLWHGRKRLRLYRQMKMYNDPTLNPYLYNRPVRKAS